MAVTVTSAAVHKEFTTLNVVKNEMNITGSSVDALLVDGIRQSRDIITRFTGREFARETIQETMDSAGGLKLVVSRTPLISITQITDDGTTISSTLYSIDDSDAGIIFKETGWKNTQMAGQNVVQFPLHEGKRDWSVTYIAGYIMPGSTEGAVTLPYDLERASIDIIKTFYFQASNDPTFKSEKVGDASYTRFSMGETGGGSGNGGLPPSSINILNRWKRITV